ncbi:hypothetical protein LTR78_004274 [Recurvomyces mirabilis]|uniref:Mitochondrial integral membrane protein n=1 Tax=Recurvomyces mirabilis TaxID=574656 RepID=A0AAE0WPP1_9PEZI|nr:hypothetical protein LTR78_004274 [Recurvomyces mirabilis]KAK5156058.1 hypothetical protein LTS14_005624 [Recurvomyces mirabilis]
MSLWGTKKQNGTDDHAEDEEHHNDDNMARSQPSRSREPNERDRLLPSNPRPPHQDGYLDPDDPAVSPYNLWSVRALRFFSVFFLGLTFLWWVLLLVSIFVSPPGLHTRGSGFFDFSYTTLTTGLLLTSLLFFSNPSLAMRVCQGIIAVLLLVDVIIIVSVTRLRFEESAPGIASVSWATVIAIWCVFQDRIVAWGKREEEERLTGRPETRRTLREWIGVLVATVILVVYILIVLLMTGTLILRARDTGLEMDGTRYYVDGHKYQVHLACVGDVTTDKNGERNPTILIEAGETPSEYDFEHWAYAAYQNGTIDRYCYWDRPGYAWSDNAPSPHSAGMSADNLAEALAIAGEQGPWICVSAGYGSIVSRIFSARHFRDVKGLMLIDPLHEDLLHRIASPYRGFVLWGWGVISPLGIQRLAGSIFSGVTREDRVFGDRAYQGGKFIKAQLQENLVADSLTRSEVSSARTIQTPDTPLVIISSGISTRRDQEWADKQKDLSKLTDKLVSWDVVNKAPHFVWRTLEGRTVMEKRLGELVKASKKVTYATTEE